MKRDAQRTDGWMSGLRRADRWRSDPRWLRAAALGGVWAALEIVVGSFLHNLTVPFRGQVLTAMAVLLVSGAQRRWGQRGVVARAGLVAAIMKSASPSAVLLGPMLAIGMEGLGFELGLAIGRGGLAGCVIGGALAMTWTVLHPLLTMLLNYGMGLVEAYRQLVVLAAEQLGPLPLGAAGPLAAVALLSVCAGIAAAVAGWRVGGGADVPTVMAAGSWAPPAPPLRSAVEVRASLPLLVLLLAALPLGLVALSRVPLAVAGASLAVLLAGAGVRYRTALRRLLRPGFWIGVLMIAGTAALVLRSRSGAAPSAALAIAVLMTLRAMFVTACFAAIGVELSHPGLRAWLGRHRGGALLGAVEAAFATLPRVVASVPAARDLVRRPVAALASVLPTLDALVGELARPRRRAPVVVVTGERGAGKTTLAAAAVERLHASGLRVGGVLAPGTYRDGKRFSIDVVAIPTGARLPLARRETTSGWVDERSFWVNPVALALGREALSIDDADVVVVDEVGPWELRGSGWSGDLDALVQRDVSLLLVVRRECLPAVLSRWRLEATVVFDVEETQPERIAAAISGALDRRGG
jgi:nucleoside-triphosphatase THEP1